MASYNTYLAEPGKITQSDFQTGVSDFFYNGYILNFGSFDFQN
jgi:hypothetical protein